MTRLQDAVESARQDTNIISLSLLILDLLSVLVFTVAQIQSTIVQSLSSSYAVVLGGYGPGYSELAMVEVVKHDKVCKEVIADIPPALARFLGDVSGLAEFVDNKVSGSIIPGTNIELFLY